jgi:hypothetical protein
MEPSARRKHRPRSRPTPRGKRTQITDNDIFGIFEPLSRHAQLTTKQLVAFDRRHPSKVRNRLTDLYHEGAWLERLSERMTFANALFTDEFYRLKPDAEELLAARSIVPAEPWVKATRIGGNAKLPSRILRLAHDHMASDIVLDIEIGARTTPGVRFRNHIEIIQQAPARTRALPSPLRVPVPPVAGAPRCIEPDALFAIGDRLYVLEADMGSESLDTIVRGKIIAWREIVACGVVDDHFGFDNLTVLFMTASEKRMRNVMAVLAGVARNRHSVMFGFSYRSLQRELLQVDTTGRTTVTASWHRVGCPALTLT